LLSVYKYILSIVAWNVREMMLPGGLSSVLESYGNVGVTNDYCKQKQILLNTDET
jgi:hypothetical protein